MHVSNIQMIGNGKTIVSIILLKKKKRDWKHTRPFQKHSFHWEY